MICTESTDGSLIIVSGLPGVGKSTISRIISEEIDAEHLRTDEIRKDLFHEPQYDPEENQQVYEEMFSRASEELKSNNNVVLDATFSDESKRETLRTLAQSIGSDLLFIKVEANKEAVEERLANRENDASDADYQVYQEKKQSFDELLEDVEVIDNSGQISETRRAVESLLIRHPAVDALH